jgi:hypothetical protein
MTSGRRRASGFQDVLVQSVDTRELAYLKNGSLQAARMMYLWKAAAYFSQRKPSFTSRPS